MKTMFTLFNVYLFEKKTQTWKANFMFQNQTNAVHSYYILSQKMFIHMHMKKKKTLIIT